MIDYIIIGTLWAASLVGVYYVTKSKYKKTAKKSVANETIIPINETHQSSEKSQSDDSVTVEPVKLKSPIAFVNQWKLTVNGTAKYDIRVDWSDGSTFVLSGLAPNEHQFKKPVGVLPILVAGIPPEWADDGISYEWTLNEIHWS